MEDIGIIMMGFLLALGPRMRETTSHHFVSAAGDTGKFIPARGDTIMDHFPAYPFSFELPRLLVPDSLGGKDLSGHVKIRFLVDSLGVIHSYDILRLKATDVKLGIDIDYRYGSKKERTKMLTYRKWLDKFVGRVKVKRIPGVPLPHAFKTQAPARYSPVVLIHFNK
jgi:hypothetical protein